MTRTVSVATWQFTPEQTAADVLPLPFEDSVFGLPMSSDPCSSLRVLRMDEPVAGPSHDGDPPDEGALQRSTFNDVVTPAQRRTLAARFLAGADGIGPEAAPGARLEWSEVDLVFGTLRTDSLAGDEPPEATHESAEADALRLRTLYRRYGVRHVDSVIVRGPGEERHVVDRQMVSTQPFDVQALARDLQAELRRVDPARRTEVTAPDVIVYESRLEDGG